MRTVSRIRSWPASMGLLATLALVAGLTSAVPATADHTTFPARVTLMGDLMDELGCPGAWDSNCTETDLIQVGDSSVFSLAVTLPPGSYEFKVRLNGSWDENYGAGGVAGGPNIPLALQHDAALTFTYDHASHRVGVAPTEAQPGLQRADRRMARDSLRRDLTRERFYFVMADRFENGDPSNDTGGFGDDRLQNGFDPSHKGFYHGGDLRGLIDRLDYIEGLGTTAIWMTPSFKNKPVQGAPGSESAGYHGYWITDFTQIDPHLGTNAELKELVDEAHGRGIKVFFDIITNHTADVLDYEPEAYNDSGVVPYRSKEDAPYVDVAGNPFDDRDFASGDTFPEVDLDSFPYRPAFRDPSDATAKTPDWLNDPTMYHNRGTSSFTGENSEYGDFPSGPYSALDDLWTERPEVVDGMTEIYQQWVEKAGVDGFRIDTVKHVNMQFWQRFGPALQGYAASVGNEDFFMFGEVYDANPEFMSRYTTTGRLQSTVDFGFQAVASRFAQGKPTVGLRDQFAGDDWFIDADSNAYSLPTFLGNHDMGRIGRFIAVEGHTGTALQQRDELAHSLMYLTRGQPVVYYGDEQGFTGDGGDQDARQDMFPSQVATYNDDDLIGTDDTTAVANFDRDHPVYRHIASLAQLRQDHPTLADGAQIHRFASDRPGIYAFSRISADGPDRNVEYVVAANNADDAKTATFDTFAARQRLQLVWVDRGADVQDRLRSDDEGRVSVRVPARSTVVYRATKPLADDKLAPAPAFNTPTAGGVVGGRAEIGVGVPGADFNQVTVAVRPVGADDWEVVGTDDNAPYRVFHDVRALPRGTLLEYRAVVRDHDGDLGVAATYAMVGEPAPPGGGGGDAPVGPVTQPSAVSIPGSHGSELGCPDSSTDGGTDPGDWDPACAQAQLALDLGDGIWKKTATLDPEGFGFKAAINNSWDENYGVGGVRNAGDIGYTAPGGPVSFYYDHRTHWVTNDVLDEIVTVAGDFQSELGCAGDWAPSCMRAWLQDPDDDDVYTLFTTEVPPGTWQGKATVGLTWGEEYPAGNVVFTVAEGEATRFRFDTSTNTFSVSTESATPPDSGPDLTTNEAQWVERDRVTWATGPGEAAAGYRLYWGEPGSLTLDAETIEGGDSVRLTLAEDGSLRLSPQAARTVRQVWQSGGAGYQVAVGAFDRYGRLVDATGVAVAGP